MAYYTPVKGGYGSDFGPVLQFSVLQPKVHSVIHFIQLLSFLTKVDGLNNERYVVKAGQNLEHENVQMAALHTPSAALFLVWCIFWIIDHTFQI